MSELSLVQQTLLAVGTGSLSGLVSAYVGYRWMRRADVELARRTGQLAVGQLALKVLGRDIDDTHPPSLHWLHVRPDEEPSAGFARLSAELINVGDRAIEDATLSVRVPNAYAAKGAERLTGFAPGHQTQRQVEGNFTRSHFYLRTLAPNLGAEYSEDLEVHETVVRDTIDHAMLKGETLTYSAEFSIILSIASHSNAGTGPGVDVFYHVSTDTVERAIANLTDTLDKKDRKLFGLDEVKGLRRVWRHRKFYRERPSRRSPIIVSTNNEQTQSQFEVTCIGNAWAYPVWDDAGAVSVRVIEPSGVPLRTAQLGRDVDGGTDGST